MNDEDGRPLEKQIHDVKERIKTAAVSCGRSPDDITLVAVSKTKSPDMVRRAAGAGLTVFGENYIQEARDKIASISLSGLSWHFIGHLQRNKAKYAVKLFDLIHTVDSLKLATELDKQAEKIGKVQDVLIQVNTGMEESKSGIAEKDAMGLARDMSGLRHIKVKGLMTMPPFFDAPEKVTPFFKALNRIRNRIREENIPNIQMSDLSMGMTGDFEAAIKEGATLIRVGTAIFGRRD
jgi:pyridoxal phosphate enzyme (YggS family)